MPGCQPLAACNEGWDAVLPSEDVYGLEGVDAVLRVVEFL